MLVAEGFDVILVNGRQTKNIKGKKTDIKDRQWIQKLHALGLLSSSFLPDSTTDIIRTHSRHRQNILKQSGATAQKQIDETDKEIKKLLKDIIKNDDNKKNHTAKKKPISKKTKMPLEIRT